MEKNALLVLADGTVLRGRAISGQGTVGGEVVFNTSMTGYQEMLTDPSYRGEILTLTFPLIGCYGVDPEVSQSEMVQAKGLVISRLYEEKSHPSATLTLAQWLREQGVLAIEGVDTRLVAMRLREKGAMNGVITTELSEAEAIRLAQSLPDLGEFDLVSEVTPREPQEVPPKGEERFRVACLHCGMKRAIVKELASRGLRLMIYPAGVGVEEVLEFEPHGLFISNGPGDPATCFPTVEPVLRELVIRRGLPTFGICLGNQLLGLLFGLRTYKLKFGHRGANHPVMDLAAGRVNISSHNHGYAVHAPYPGYDPEVRPPALPDGPYPAPDRPEVLITHLNVNDGSVEGLRHRELPAFAVQYHPEGSPGPLDNTYLFDQFVELIAKHA